MSRFRAGWHTTFECQDEGYPIRYSWTEDEYSDVAHCRTREAAKVVIETLQHMNAKPIEKEREE